MIPQKLPNANAGQITVTSTATSLRDLIITAGSADFDIEPEINACDLQVETDSIRYFIDGNTPTSSKGFLLSSTGTNIVQFRGEAIRKLKLIRAGSSDATVNIRVGKILL